MFHGNSIILYISTLLILSSLNILSNALYSDFINQFITSQSDDVLNATLFSGYFDPHLMGKHLVFMGDSLTRYQYLTLVYALRYNRWPESEGKPTIFIESWDGIWQDFLVGSNEMLQPNEWCDCFRAQHYDISRIFENRYYIDHTRDLMVSYLAFNGKGATHSFVHGHWHDHRDTDTSRSPQTQFIQPHWSYNMTDIFTWIPSISGDHRPVIIVMNNGHHEHEFNNPHFASAVASYASRYSYQFIWKTTTARLSRTHNSDHEMIHGVVYPHDVYMCQLAQVTCFNISWTEHVRRDLFVDDYHYKSVIYNALNIDLMSIIAKR